MRAPNGTEHLNQLTLFVVIVIVIGGSSGKSSHFSVKRVSVTMWCCPYLKKELKPEKELDHHTIKTCSRFSLTKTQKYSHAPSPEITTPARCVAGYTTSLRTADHTGSGNQTPRAAANTFLALRWLHLAPTRPPNPARIARTKNGHHSTKIGTPSHR
jgi:hypothetical protein